MTSQGQPSNPDPSEAPSAELNGTGGAPTAETSTTNPTSRGATLSVAVFAALAAGLIAWAVGETRVVRSVPEEQDVVLMGHTLKSTTTETIGAAALQTAVRSFVLLGTLFGLFMGVAGGLSRGSVRSALRAGLVGLVTGGATAALCTLLVVPGYSRLSDAGPVAMTTTLLAHLALWGPLAGVGGIALALGIGRIDRVPAAFLAGAAGALLGIIAYDFAGALIFPLDETHRPISTTAITRLIARLLVVLPAAALATREVTGRRAR